MEIVGTEVWNDICIDLNTRRFVSDPNSLIDEYGREPFQIALFGEPTVVISDEPRIRLALTKYAGVLSGREGNREVCEELFGNSVLYQDGIEHKRLQTVLQPLFAEISDDVKRRVRDLTRLTIGDYERSGEKSVVLDFSRSLMARISADLYLGLRLTLEEATWISIQLEVLAIGLYASSVDPETSPTFAASIAARKNVVEFLEERRSEIESGPLGELDLTASDRLDQAVTLLFAGVDTIAATIAWCVIWAKPQVDDSVSADYADLFHAALVKYPPVYFIPRRATEAVDLLGIAIPRGTIVNLMISELHRQLEKGATRRHFLPFGKGLKQCPGKPFSLQVGPAIVEEIAVSGLRLYAGDAPLTAGYVPGIHPINSPLLLNRDV